MIPLILLAIKDMKRRWGLILVLILLFTIVFASFLTILSHYRSASRLYTNLEQDWLVVGNSDGLSEIHGSRITPLVRDQLIASGYENPVPEIHQIVGTNLANGTLMRGIRLEDYRKTNAFTMLNGIPLEAGNPSRLTMIGETLARTREVRLGDDLLLRGRKFTVVGIFKTGSIQDNEAWISLTDAQTLLNFGEDVSLYLIPDTGPLQIGDIWMKDILISQRGETGSFFGSSITAYFNYFGVIGILLGIATAISMTNLLWRLAYLRRHEFGILRSVGFGFKALSVYFFVQSGFIIVTGIVLGILLAVFFIFTLLKTFSAYGFGVSPNFEPMVVLTMSLIAVAFFLVSSILPLVSIYKKPIPDLLGRN